MADVHEGVQRPPIVQNPVSGTFTGGGYISPLGGVVYASPTDLSGGAPDGSWITGQFDRQGRLRVIDAGTEAATPDGTTGTERLLGEILDRLRDMCLLLVWLKDSANARAPDIIDQARYRGR